MGGGLGWVSTLACGEHGPSAFGIQLDPDIELICLWNASGFDEIGTLDELPGHPLKTCGECDLRARRLGWASFGVGVHVSLAGLTGHFVGLGIRQGLSRVIRLFRARLWPLSDWY